MADVIEKSALRYTPAGLPAIDVALRHASQVEQEGRSRQVAFEIRGRAIGAMAEALQGLPLGSTAAIEGFLGSHRNGRGILLHIERCTAHRND